MGSTVKEFGALDANGQQPRDGRVSRGEQRRPSGSGTGDWLVNVSGDVVVPMSTSDIVEGLRAAKLSERSLVWRLGMPDWIPLGDVPQLKLAAGSVRPSAPPPASARVVQASTESRESARRSTLPYGFPAARDPASVREPLGLVPSSPSSTPLPPRHTGASPKASSDDDDALAVYDRPIASLTFSDSVRAEWHGAPRTAPQSAPARVSERALTPVPAITARLSERARPAFPNSLIPTTSELESARSGARLPGHADLSVVLASDFRAAKASTKRVALWAALASAVVASGLTLWLVRMPAWEAPSTSAAAQPAAAPPVAAAPVAALPVAPPPVELPTPSASASAIRAAIPRQPKAALRPRVKPVPRVEPPVAASEPAASDNPYGESPSDTDAHVATPQQSAPASSAQGAPKEAPAPHLESAAPPVADPSSAP